MKKITVVILFLTSIVTFAQEKLEEGSLISKLTFSTDNEQLNSQFEGLSGTESITYIKGVKSRSETSNPISGNSITISDLDKSKMLMLLDSPGVGKTYVIQDLKLDEETLKSISVIKNNDTKTILGYKCDKYTTKVTLEGVEQEIVFYTTEEIPIPVNQQTVMFGKKLKGFPMLTIIKVNQFGTSMTITSEVIKINREPVPDDKFDMTVPEGYQKLPGQ